MNKKGNMIAMGKQFVIMLLIVGILNSVTGLVIGAFRDSQTVTSPGFAVADAGMNATLNFSNQLGTVGTIAGVALLLVVIGAGLLSLFKKKGGF